jgi:hypothetical protein
VFESLPISKSSRKILASAVSEPPSGSLFVFVASGDIAFETACAYTEAVVPVAHRSSEVTIAVPSGDRWSKGDVEDRIHAPSLRATLSTPFVVVKDAHLMEQPTYDSLLKTIEEPANGCVFVLCTPDTSLLPKTYLSRASWVLDIGPLDEREAVARLVKEGAEKASATKAVSLCGDLLSLASMASKDQNLLNSCGVLALELPTEKPVSFATQACEHIEALASLYTKTLRIPDAQMKATSRQMCARVLLSLEHSLSKRLRDTSITPEEIESLSRRQERIDQARGMLWRYARIDMVLTHALL